MRSLLIYTLLCFLAVTSCNRNQEVNEKQATIDHATASDTTCPVNRLSKKYSKSIEVSANYYECEPDWKTNLEIHLHGETIFAADPATEYQFNKYTFPTSIKDSQYRYLLIERDERPLPNKVEVFRIAGKKVDSVFTVPLFYKEGKDLDDDGIIEFYTSADNMEQVAPGKISYNPIIIYEIQQDLIRFDSSATAEMNRKIYGEFYGTACVDSLLFDREMILSRWP